MLNGKWVHVLITCKKFKVWCVCCFHALFFPSTAKCSLCLCAEPSIFAVRRAAGEAA